MLNEEKKSQVFTFGCRLNFSESEIIKDHLKLNNLEDIVVFNTCSVTSEAERKAKQAIRKLKKTRPESKIVVTGCAAQINPKSWFAMPEVNHVLGNNEKLNKNFWVGLSKCSDDEMVVSDIMRLREYSFHQTNDFSNQTRSFIQIQNGCDHRCTFCIIPFGRGNSRSVFVDEIIKSIQNALNNNVKEIVLTGVDLTSWGKDFKERKSLGFLLKTIFSSLPDLPRLRVSSIDPAEIDHEFMDILADEERFMPHLHLSIQHGDDLILKRMKRRHLYRDVINFVDEAKRRRSDIIFGADFISGFPTENDQSHQNSIKLIKEADIKYAHIFPFSPRKETPAYKMKMLPKEVINYRAKELRDIIKTKTEFFLKSIVGTKQKVLIEKNNSGYTPQFTRVKFQEDVKSGKIIETNIVKAQSTFVDGKVE